MGLSNVYSSGINNVGSYQVSGRPFTKTGAQQAASATTTISFPSVTKQIVFMNRGSSDMFDYFNSASPAANKFKIASGEQHTFNVKCKEIFTDGAVSEQFSVYASLTHIPTARMFGLTGPGITE